MPFSVLWRCSFSPTPKLHLMENTTEGSIQISEDAEKEPQQNPRPFEKAIFFLRGGLTAVIPIKLTEFLQNQSMRQSLDIQTDSFSEILINTRAIVGIGLPVLLLLLSLFVKRRTARLIWIVAAIIGLLFLITPLSEFPGWWLAYILLGGENGNITIYD